MIASEGGEERDDRVRISYQPMYLVSCARTSQTRYSFLPSPSFKNTVVSHTTSGHEGFRTTLVSNCPVPSTLALLMKVPWLQLRP